jgi:L-malate glycosyltransferase
MIAPENRAQLDGKLGAPLRRFALDESLRKRVGAANRARAVAEYDEGAMIARYGALYGNAVGRSRALID